MADKSIRLADNPAGKWYVDETCTPCHVCLDEAGPSTAAPLLRYNADETKVFFVKQPENPDEESAAQRALEICPTQAIGSDGE